MFKYLVKREYKNKKARIEGNLSSAYKLAGTVLLGTAAAFPLLVGTSAMAEDDAGDTVRRGSLIEEVTVVAQKRSQSLQDVGIAISAFSGDQLKNLGFDSSVEIAAMVPNVAVSGSYGGQMSQYTVRGVTQNDFNDHVESVIAVYIDDSYVAMQQGQTFSMFDVERVEVLKGPQGTLFGRNATGGLVHFISKKPTEEFEGYVDVTYGRFDEIRLEGAVSGPITDRVRARLSAFYTEHDGYLKNAYPEETFVPAAFEGALNSTTLPGAGADLGGIDSNWAVRAHVEFDLTDRATLLVTGFASESKASIGPYQQVPSMSVFDANGVQIDTVYLGPNEVCEAFQVGTGCINGPFDNNPGDVLRPVPGADFNGYLDPDGSKFTTSVDFAFDDFSTNDTYGTTVNLEIDFDNFTLTSITDYKKFKKHFGLDLDASPVNQFFWIGDADTDAFTQEIRAVGQSGDITWVTGAYYLYIDNTSVHGFGALPDSAYFFPAWDQPRIVDMSTKSYSAFGQVEYQISSDWSVIAGLRGTREKKDYRHEVIFAFPTTGGDPLNWDFEPSVTAPGFEAFFRLPYEQKSKETLWSWKAQVEYQPNDDLLVYAGVTQGVKAGSFNAGDPSIPEAGLPYGNETLINYELGFKSTILNGKARLNGAVYYYDYDDYQASRWTGVANVIINADAEMYGGELEMMAQVTPDLEARLAAGYQDNKVKDVPVAGELRNVETTFAPKFTGSAMLRYTVPTPVFDGSLAFQSSVNHQGKVWHNLSNFTATRLKSYTIVNARVSWLNAKEDLRIDISGENLTNKAYDVIGFDLSQVFGGNLQAQGKPRWWRISINKAF